jgi:hypothetical protein
MITTNNIEPSPSRRVLCQDLTKINQALNNRDTDFITAHHKTLSDSPFSHHNGPSRNSLSTTCSNTSFSESIDLKRYVAETKICLPPACDSGKRQPNELLEGLAAVAISNHDDDDDLAQHVLSHFHIDGKGGDMKSHENFSSHQRHTETFRIFEGEIACRFELFFRHRTVSWSFVSALLPEMSIWDVKKLIEASQAIRARSQILMLGHRRLRDHEILRKLDDIMSFETYLHNQLPYDQVTYPLKSYELTEEDPRLPVIRIYIVSEDTCPLHGDIPITNRWIKWKHLLED